MKTHIKIGMGQLLVEGGEPERNLDRAELLIREAAQNRCELVLLPECLDFGWTHPSSLTECQSIPGPFSDRFCHWARENRLYICAGLTEKMGAERYNTAILINDQGEIILKYHKINLLGVEQPFYSIGKTLNVIDTPFGRLGLNICADNYFDSLTVGHTLARMGAQMILSPSSWTVDYFIDETQDPYKEKWFRPYTILASLYNMVIVGSTSVGYIVGGPYEGKKMVGHSLAVGPEGVIAKGVFNEFSSDLVVADIRIPVRPEKGTEIGVMLLKKGYQFEVIKNL